MSSARLLLGLAVPPLILLAAIVLVSASTSAIYGISLRSWCLFGCAPLTSAILALLARVGAG